MQALIEKGANIAKAQEEEAMNKIVGASQNLKGNIGKAIVQTS